MRTWLTSLMVVFACCLFSEVQAQRIPTRDAREVKRLLKQEKVKEAQNVIIEMQQQANRKVQKTYSNKQAEADSTAYWYLRGVVNQHLLAKENTKLYYNNKVDTVALFTCLYDMITDFVRCYPAMNQLSENKEVRDAFQKNLDNLSRAGSFYLNRNDLDNSYRYFYQYVSLEEQGLISTSDSLLQMAYYNCIYVAHQQQDYNKVIFLAEKYVKKDFVNEATDIMLCQALDKLNRTDEWIQALRWAVERHPEQFFFYASLIDYYISHQANEKALLYADELLQSNPKSARKNFVKGYVYQQIKEYKKAVEYMEKAYELRPEFPQNLSGLGNNYVNLAIEFENSLKSSRFTAEQKEQLTLYYQKAEKYLEECRKLMPNDPSFWAAGLYKAYYFLNEGEKLDEIEQILN